MLAVPGALLGGLFLVRLEDGHRERSSGTSRFPRRDDQQPFLAVQYCVALAIAALSGFIYAATMNFMPRYLDGAGLDRWGIPPEGMRNYLTAGVLLLGVIGQYTAGRIARPHTLEPWLAVIMFLVAPSLLAMAAASGAWRLWAAGAFAVVYFMSQPVYNSLIPRYVPPHRRSLGYGVNFTVTFGIGGLGATFAGYAPSQGWNYGTLAACAAAAGFLALVLWKLHGQHKADEAKHGN
jgi:MFS family permease